MNSKNYGIYAKNINKINGRDANEKLFNIENLVVGDILMTEKNDKGINYYKVPSKYIFEKFNNNGTDHYRETLSNTTIKSLDDPFVDHKTVKRFITNIENLTDYIDFKTYKDDKEEILLTLEDILDMQTAVNMISEEEKKNKIKQKSL